MSNIPPHLGLDHAVTAEQLMKQVHSAFGDGSSMIQLPDDYKVPRSELELIVVLKMIAEYKRVTQCTIPVPAKDVDAAAMNAAIRAVLLSERLWPNYVVFRWKRTILLNPSNLRAMSRKITSIITDQSKLDQIVFLCHTPLGRRRKRLVGGGRSRNIPLYLERLVYARMVSLTNLYGSFSRADLVKAFKDYAHFDDGINVYEPGAIPPPGDARPVLLSPVQLHRFRARYNIKGTRGESVTAVNAVGAMNAGFESLVRCLAAQIVMGVSPDDTGNMDQTMIFVLRGATERAYETGGSGSAPGHRARSGGRSTFTVNSVNYGGRFKTVYVVLDSNSKDGRLTRAAIKKLNEIGLSPGENILERSKTVVYVTSSNNGWMKGFHMPSLIFTQKSAVWKILTGDNWFGFDKACAEGLEDQRVFFFEHPSHLLSDLQLA